MQIKNLVKFLKECNGKWQFKFWLNGEYAHHLQGEIKEFNTTKNSLEISFEWIFEDLNRFVGTPRWKLTTSLDKYSLPLANLQIKQIGQRVEFQVANGGHQGLFLPEGDAECIDTP